MFIAPNQTGIMNSLPASQRGAGAGMAGTFNSSAQVLSIGIFFTLMILGLASTLPGALYHGLIAQGVSPAVATRVSHLPPVGSLFAAFLGYNPMQILLGHAELAHLPHATARYLTSRQFFPHLIAPAFSRGLTEAFVLRRRRVPARRRGLAAPGRQVPLRGGADAETGRRCRDGCRRRRRWPRPNRCWWTDMASRRTQQGPEPAPADAAEPGIRISDAATRAGVSARTLRYYEELGLLTPLALHRRRRAALHARRPGPPDRILELREVLGMNLDEIREFLSFETRLDELRASLPRHARAPRPRRPGPSRRRPCRRRSCSTSPWPSSSAPSWPAWTPSGPSSPVTPGAAASSWPSSTDRPRPVQSAGPARRWMSAGEDTAPDVLCELQLGRLAPFGIVVPEDLVRLRRCPASTARRTRPCRWESLLQDPHVIEDAVGRRQVVEERGGDEVAHGDLVDRRRWPTRRGRTPRAPRAGCRAAWTQASQARSAAASQHSWLRHEADAAPVGPPPMYLQTGIDEDAAELHPAVSAQPW